MSQKNKKYLVIIGDGIPGWSIASLNNKTTLEAANSPNLDFLAQHGTMGLAHHVPKGYKPGSDVANLSIFGYAPQKYYTGRAPIEAISQGIDLLDTDIVARANLVSIQNNKMQDFTAGHIDTKSAHQWMNILNNNLQSEFPEITFYGGVSYRNLMKVTNSQNIPETTPPHDITGKQIDSYLPEGTKSNLFNSVMKRAKNIMANNILPTSKKELSKANAVWLWGAGKKISLPSFKDLFGLQAAVISAVDLIKGIGLASGLNYIEVPGITGFVDTNFKGKAEYALNALEKYDLVFIHLEAADESGHIGDADLKIKSIELIDQKVIGTILKDKRYKDLNILFTPDHATPIETKTHSMDSVPWIIYRRDDKQEGSNSYSEKEAAKTGIVLGNGTKLIREFLQ